MDINEIKAKFELYKREIEEILTENDINYFMEDFDQLFNSEDKRYINESYPNEKVTKFLSCFYKLPDLYKYVSFKKYAEQHNQWIFTLLSSEEMQQLKAQWTVLANLLKLIQKMKTTYKLDKLSYCYLCNEKVISQASKDSLITELENKGHEAALFKLFNVLSKKTPDWFGHILYLFARSDFNFIHLLFEDIDTNKDMSDDEMKKICLDYAQKFIAEHVERYNNENIIETGNKDVDEDDSDTISDYGSLAEDSDDDSVLIAFDSTGKPKEERKSVELKLRAYQEELVEAALNGINTIIYAPTGSGKTNVAVYIANDHLKKNPSGKVAFLVHRTPLVTQQCRVFEKYMDSKYKVSSMRGKSDNILGPLIAHMQKNDVIIMTSDMLRNALTVDDGNKISSICEFSLIFFDECHNCMKSHPYTKIMDQYFKASEENPAIKLPQIVGLTASPRSNKRDDLPGMKMSFLQLCANLDCFHISMVTEHKEDMKKCLSRPKQILKLTEERIVDEFEGVIIKEMEYCERKLQKMKNEKYFAATEIRSIPIDKYNQKYMAFLGDLKNLNTVTQDECDGKQKAYSIYRYLNAYHRGLIVNQMFDQHHAKKSIERHLKHRGIQFSCSYDEEFYQHYKKNIVNNTSEQTDNPAIHEILSQIIGQMRINPESKIIVFVREVNFTNHLVETLKNYNIFAEAIVGVNTKTEFNTCTLNEIDNILQRFKSGKTKVLVSTTVVEEGLDVVDCNMVISYGHVTNETAMLQRQGRARSLNSNYVLILPPMLGWLSKKEIINRRRLDMMNNLINDLQLTGLEQMENEIKMYQKDLISSRQMKTKTNTSHKTWTFTCKNCQTIICESDKIRIIDNSHRICMIPELLDRFKVVKKAKKSYGHYENSGKILCYNCNNFELGRYILYKKVPYFQINIEQCNVTSANKVLWFRKWKEFAVHCDIPNLDLSDHESYFKSFELLE